jgi:hypothetical protein
MAVTTTLLSISTTRDAVSVPQLVQGNLILKDTVLTQPNKDSVQEVTTFTLSTSSIEPLTVTVRRTLNTKEGTVHYAMKISTAKRSVDADGIVVELAPVESGAWVTRPISSYDLTDVNIEALIGNVYGLWFPAVDGSDVPTGAILNMLRMGVTNVY